MKRFNKFDRIFTNATVIDDDCLTGPAIYPELTTGVVLSSHFNDEFSGGIMVVVKLDEPIESNLGPLRVVTFCQRLLEVIDGDS